MRDGLFYVEGDASSSGGGPYYRDGRCARCGRIKRVFRTQVAGEICVGCVVPAGIAWATRGRGSLVNGTASG